ncbi:MAG: exodeoxyribonuclease VII small subunit [Candidatus Omnitrophota bacterium]|nr:exodeoxyribonuclease VII small subunit [Candidatus Omnitrophota bacterium]
MKDTNFEKDLQKLEKIVAELEDGEFSLDSSMKKYEEGIKLARACREQLEKAQKKIEILIKKDENLFEKRPFEET